MKRTVWVLTLLLSVCACASAQSASESKCPTLEVTGPSGVTAPGTIMPFVVLVSEPRLKNLTFTWTVSAGKIVEGQGSRVIKVTAPRDHNGVNVGAKVTVDGLPPGCPSSATQGGVVAPQPFIDDTQEYGPILLNDEKSRLFSACVMLKNNAGSQIMIVKYLPKVRKVDRDRIQTLSNFLVGQCGLLSTQFVFVTRTALKTKTVLSIRPIGSKLPD